MVPIRDANLIGRKIDCPKCKYRFVVEDPGAETETDDEEVDQPKKKRTRDERTSSKDSAASKRVMTREEMEEEEAERSKKGAPTKLILGIGLGVFGIVLLVVVGFLVWGGVDSSTPPKQGGTPAPAKASPTQQAKGTAAATEEAAPVASTSNVSTEALTNFLPPDAEGVCNVRMQDLARTQLGHAVFETPGSFRVEALQKRLGLSVEDIQIIIQGWNFTKNWTFNVIHTTKPFSPDAVKTALRAKPVTEKIEEQDYFILDANPWLAAVGKLSFATALMVAPTRVPARTKPLAMRIYDDQTLIVADEDILKEFLKVKGTFPRSQQKPKVVKEDTKAAPRAPAQDAADPELRGRGPRGAPGGPGGAGAALRPGAQTPSDESPKAEEPASGTYLTIDQRLKDMLDRVDTNQPVVSLALDSQAAGRAGLPPLGYKGPGAPTILPSLATVIENAEIIGAAVRFKVEGIALALIGDMQTDDAASRREETIINQSGKEIASAFTAALGTSVLFQVPGDSQQAAPVRGAAPVPQQGVRGRGGRFAEGGDDGGGAPRGAPAGVGDPGAMARNARNRGRGALGGQGGLSPQLGVPQPNLQQRQNQTQAAPSDKPVSNVEVVVRDSTSVLLSVNLLDPAANAKLFNDQISRFILRQKGYLDMVGGEPRIHELAQAVSAYVKANQGQFPRGTVARNMPSTRAGRPYPPDERVSWLTELLPYLGSEQASLRINREKSWRDPENLIAASTLIPQFINPQTVPTSWWVHYPSLGEPVAATHYVGIAGIGLDAAEYSASDPNVANKLGIFGYDRSTKMSDIKDGASNTILMAEVPPIYKRPWLAGGGATVMGVSEKNSFQPFISAEHGGKRGTYVIMADGSVRFIAEGIADDVFRAMCTINGGANDASFVVNRDAVKVEPPEEKPAPVAVQQKAEPPTPPPAKAEPQPAPKVQTPGPAQTASFGTEVTDILTKRCARCHTGDGAKKEFRIFSSVNAPNPAVDKQLILKMVKSGKMPPKGKGPPLSPDERDTVVTWAAGAN
jgi:hypothetical protein